MWKNSSKGEGYTTISETLEACIIQSEFENQVKLERAQGECLGIRSR